MEMAGAATHSGPTVSPALLRRLELYDSFLAARWNPQIERWQIGRFRPFSEILDYVMTVANEDGSYRPLDERVFEEMVSMDHARVGPIRGLLNSIDEHNRLLGARRWETETPVRRSLWRESFLRHVRGRKVFGPRGPIR